MTRPEQLVTTYLSQSLDLQRRGNEVDWQSIADFFPEYFRSSLLAVSPLYEERPWIGYEATRFLTASLKREMRVFEYGAGGSTLFLLNRTGEVCTAEHDATWIEQVRLRVQMRGHQHWRPFLVPPDPDRSSRLRDPADPNAYLSKDPRYAGSTFARYASVIDAFSDGYFDIVLVDGRSRPSCVKHSIPKIKLGGFLVLDDADRNYYNQAKELLNSNQWEKWEFFGPGISCLTFWGTCFWRRRN